MSKDPDVVVVGPGSKARPSRCWCASPTDQLRQMMYAYPAFHRVVGGALADLERNGA